MDENEHGVPQRRRKQHAKRPKPVTAARMLRYTQWYLERWSSSEGNLDRILWRRAEKGLAEHGGDRGEVAGWIAQAVEQAREYGWVNDERYTADVVRAQRRKGASERAIRSRLMSRRVPPELIDEVLGGQEQDSELKAASRLARRRKVGPWRRKPVDPDGRQKELAKLARAGFRWNIAKEVVDAETPDDLPWE